MRIIFYTQYANPSDSPDLDLEVSGFLLQKWMKDEAHIVANQLCDNYHYYNLHAWVSKSLGTL